MENWGSNYLVTYLELAASTQVAALEKKFPAYLKRHMKDEHWKHFKLFLQPFIDGHSCSSSDITHDYVNYQKFDIRYTYVFRSLRGLYWSSPA